MLTSSVCDRFGSGVTVPGGRVRVAKPRPGLLHRPEPSERGGTGNKRPYHTIVPTLVLQKQGTPMLGMGVVGGVMQPQGQLQILHRVLAGADLASAVEAGRFRLIGNGQVTTEATLEPSWRSAIGDAGYDLVDSADVIGGFGGAQAVLRTTDTLTAASDPRRDGTSTVTLL